MAESGKSTPENTAGAVEDGDSDIAGFGYERARDELAGIVKILEQGGLDLDESLTLWERGEALANRCERHLEGARLRVADALHRTDSEQHE
ncbi:exodeoxyribonuclease VII small subunit [Nocardia sp. 004]|uniref:exodeoxyribonuclease VII small subunit n=1 Tax=Nocardia sp. 004 TaxID=3385978 RepID=UPI00399F8935